MQVVEDTNVKINANLNTNLLKIIAIITMFMDHLGKIILPDIIILQIIGRLAFPIFAYCLVVGFLYTHNIKRYALRLGAFGIISQPIYVLTFQREWFTLNVILYLLIGLLTIYALKEKHYLIFTVLIIFSYLANISYGINGILLMLLFYLFRDKRSLSIIMTSILLTVPYLMGNHFYIGGIGIDIQIFASLSLPLIYYKTNFNFKMNKYMFYLFYPIHLAVIYVMSLM